MNAFAAYSDSEGSDAGDGTATEPAVFRPAWQQNDDSGSSEEEEGGSADPPVQVGPGDKRAAAGGTDPVEPRKRKLLDPFAAMSSANTSFLAAAATAEDEPAYFTAESAVDDKEAATALPADRPAPAPEPARVGGGQEGNLTAASVPAIPRANKDGRGHAKETTRQKNARKQKLGQANFTVKSNRECPDIARLD